jgi:hypothetical protein
MEYVFAAALVAMVIYGIVRAASGDRYSKMTEEEFEAEAQRTSHIGNAVSEFQKVFDPSHHVEYVQEERDRKSESAESGDPPKTGSAVPPKQKREN